MDLLKNENLIQIIFGVIDSFDESKVSTESVCHLEAKISILRKMVLKESCRLPAINPEECKSALEKKEEDALIDSNTEFKEFKPSTRQIKLIQDHFGQKFSSLVEKKVLSKAPAKKQEKYEPNDIEESYKKLMR